MIHKTLLSLSLASTAVLLALGTESSELRTERLPEERSRAELYWADFDGDGRDDAYAVQPNGAARLLRNTGTGFEDVTEACGLTLDPMPTGAAWHDVDGDGRLDLFLFSAEGPSYLFRANGGAFEDWTQASGLDGLARVGSAGWLDADGDGRADLHVVTAQGHRILRNVGEGRFEAVELPLPGMTAAVETTSDTVETSVGAASIATVTATRAPRSGADVDRPTSDGLETTGKTLVVGPTAATSSPGQGLVVNNPPGVQYLGGGFQSFYCPEAMADQADPQSCVSASSVPALGMLYPLGDELFIDTSGLVGIGTLAPLANLHVDGVIRASRDTNQYFEIDDATSNGAILRAISSQGNKKPLIIENVHNGSGGPLGELNIYFRNGADGAAGTKMIIRESGDIGIGTSGPSARLDVHAGSTDVARFDTTSATTPVVFARSTPDAASGEQELRVGMTDSAASFHAVNDEHVSFMEFRIQNTDTQSGGGVSANDNVVLTLVGDAGGGRAKVPVLEITGGADIVERFESGGCALEPGTVVVIDPALPGALKSSSEPYDTKVAGVVSGAGGVNPGLCLGQEGVLEGDVLVAMTGRVWVKCSAENGAIEPGQLLTTAGLEGHAMRASDPQRRPGTVIGKAMSALDAGTGLVLVLVNLQ